MTKFEQVGINFQYDAPTKEAAIKSFKYSCTCCCSKGMRLDCDRWAISHTHAMIVAIFESKEDK